MNKTIPYTILLLEPENSKDSAVKEPLIKEGYMVNAYTSLNILSQLSAPHPEAIIVIIDICLITDKSDVEIIQVLFERRNTPVIFLFSISDSTRLQDAIYKNAHGYYARESDKALLFYMINRTSETIEITEQKLSQIALSESETQYRSLFESAHDAIFIMKDNSFISCNEATVKLFRYDSKDELMKTTPWHISPDKQPDGKDSREKALFYMNSALQGKPQNFYWQHLRKDGTLLDTSISLNMLNLGEETYLQAIARDVSDSKREERIQRAQLRLIEYASDHTVKELLQ
ncbi:MAG: PAS domain S-box protein, partial [Clostridia bacterium]|nr:PAS domain S-box protein [Clostridia bacterium]